MSIETVEIRAFSGPSVVEVNGSDQPAIVEVNQGPAGPNSVTSATTSDGTANLSISNVTTATAEVTGTLIANHIHGNLAGSVYAHVRAGEALAKGDPVYVSGSHGTGSSLIAIVSKADASDENKMPAVGVMDAAVANNATGHMVITGTVSDIDTAAYPVNAELYVAEGGGFNASPSSARAQPIARVERSNANNGAIIVKVNGLSATDATISTLVRRDSTGSASFFSSNHLSSISIGSNSLTATPITGGALFFNDTSQYAAALYSVTTTDNRYVGLPDADGYVALTDNTNGVVDLLHGGTGGTTAGTARTNLGLGTADTPTFSNLTLATGTITVPQPLAFSQTWNAAAMTFSAFQMNVTDTASNAASLLMDLRVGGVSRFNIRKDGTISFKAGANAADISSDGTGRVLISSSSTSGARINGDLQIGGTSTILLQDGAANTLAQRNGTNAQETRVYGTYTSATNFERLNLKYNSTATAFQIGTEKGSAGGTARSLEFQTDGTTRMTIGADGQSSLTQTWNAAGTTFKALDVNVTDTASASGSLLMDLRVGGVSKFGVDKSGITRIGGLTMGTLNALDPIIVKAGNAGTFLTKLYGFSQNFFTFGYYGGKTVPGATTSSNGVYAWSNSTTDADTTIDLIVARDAANTLAQRNGTNAQVTRVYDTYTSATDYHRLAIATARATASAMSGATVTLTNIIPAGAVVVGVTCKVTTAITGATSFDIGTATDVDRFGAAIAVALGTTSDNRNWTAGTVECFPAATSLILTANGSNFTGGAVYVSVQYLSGQAD